MVENVIIGKKEIFAIEFSIEYGEPDFMGPVIIWADSRYFGTLEDSAYLQTVADVLLDLSHNFAQYAFPNIVGKTDAEVLDMVKGAYAADFYHLILGDTFDDFSMTAVVIEGKVNLYWQLHEDPFFDYSGYPNGVMSATIPLDYFEQITREFAMNVGLV